MTRGTISNSVFFTIVVLCLVWGISGCGDEATPPRPKIEVEGHDTTEWSGITIRYSHHSSEQYGPAYVNLNTPEEVAAYKKQVKFLLDQLEDAERKMAVKSDDE